MVVHAVDEAQQQVEIRCGRAEQQNDYVSGPGKRPVRETSDSQAGKRMP